MAIIIHEFEVIVAQEAEEEPARRDQLQVAVTAQDVEDVLRRRAGRLARLAAH